MAANVDLFRMYLHRQPNANTKLDLRPPIVDRDKGKTVVVNLAMLADAKRKQERIRVPTQDLSRGRVCIAL